MQVLRKRMRFGSRRQNAARQQAGIAREEKIGESTI